METGQIYTKSCVPAYFRYPYTAGFGYRPGRSRGPNNLLDPEYDLSIEARHEALPVNDRARHLTTAHQQTLPVLSMYREPQ